jgi:2-hydroxy-3-oxopropionate reductase
MKRIGFIGLGIMGKPMCRNLLNAGYPLTVWSRTRKDVELLAADGASAADSPKDVAQCADIIITILPNSPQVREVVLGPGGVIEGAAQGSILVDMSSIAPLASQEIAKALAGRSIRMLDAPVSGGEPKAVEGTLSVMVGGKQADFDECLPVLKAMASSVVRVGEVGAGNVTKLANQIIVAVNIAAVSEALTLAAKAGVDPALVYQAIRGGLAGSTVLDAKAPMMLEGNIKPGFKVNLHAKDLYNVLETSHELHVALPLTAQVMEILQALKADGLGDADHSAIVRYYEAVGKASVRR